jgi:ribosomal protein S18 acetylase RimI-like enzyme
MRKVYAESHKKVGLDADYWYIALVAVSAASQGKGLGREIMRRIGHVADQQHKACYLETFGEKNIRFYQSLGYDVVREIEVVDEKASSSVPGVVMVRPLKPKDEGAV